ncbi:GGDEF domain-containing protein [Shewanella sp. Isolate13]|uniref:diguanylate cyclase DgcS n=1 Tax=Shewanella sp. Isolate13 TaxID=2908531 RepID=UPI001EFD6876|nr:GGDEF domain-containing protein [Shewanella sp. Isolate13]MCG9730466.1 GGDEF domain-containing protein [Shewanella sp. Isolate13]
MEFGLATESSPIQYRQTTNIAMSMPLEIDLVNIIQQLHQHLDPRTVFACFGQIMGQHLPLYGVRLSYKQYQFHWGKPYGYAFEQKLTFAGHQVTINYNLKAALVPSQTLMLNQLKELVLQPLINAIQYQEMSQQAMYDALTKLGNRHYYLQSVRKEIARAERNHSSFSLVALDLDNFKQLNDDYGHQLGDSALIEFSDMLNATIRDTDQAFRIGGDEFTLLVQADAKAAQVLCQRILNALSNHHYLERYQVSTSMGVTQWQEKDTEQSLYQRADHALYEAKAAGRQCYRICAA